MLFSRSDADTCKNNQATNQKDKGFGIKGEGRGVMAAKPRWEFPDAYKELQERRRKKQFRKKSKMQRTS